MGDLRYEEHLWDGVKAVYDRFASGKQSVADMIDFMSKRQQAEEHYARELQKLASRPSSAAEGRTVGLTWNNVKSDHDSQQRLRYNFAQTLQRDVVTELQTFKREQSKQKDNLVAQITALQNQLSAQQKALSSANQSFHSKSAQAEAAQSTYEKAQGDPTCKPKALNKYNSTQIRLRKEAEQADKEYHAKVQEYQAFQIQFETKMKETLKEFQQMEESRLAYLKSMMEKYLAAQDAMLQELIKSNQTLVSSTTKVDCKRDLQEWIQENKTDKTPPQPVQYEPYVSQFAHPSQKKASAPSATTPRSAAVASTRPTSATPPATAVRGGGSGGVAAAAAAAASRPSAKKGPAPAALPPASSTQQKARALFEYTAAEEGELSFAEGDTIVVLKMDDSGWWEGTLGSNRGMFPGNYCELIKDAGAANVRRCKVLFTFTAQNMDELTITEGEIVTIISKKEEWFCGTNARGKSGLFPANYVQEI